MNWSGPGAYQSKLVLAARIGFAARGILYALIGFLAFNGRSEDAHGALDYVFKRTGTPLLILLGLGFLAYASWRLLAAWCDSDGHGSDLKGRLIRIGGAFIGLIYLGFALATVQLAIWHKHSGGSGGVAEKGASTAMDLPGGTFLLWAAAAAFLVAGGYQFMKAAKLKFLHRVTDWAAHSTMVAWCGRIGLAARGFVFLTIAYLLWQAASDSNAAEAGGTADALGTMPPVLRAAIGVGLILFGLFSLVEARFRTIRRPQVERHVKRAFA